MTRAEEFAMYREHGMTYEEIAKVCHCSKQNVAQLLATNKEYLFRPFKAEQCPYIGLRLWLNENRISITELSRKLYSKTVYSGQIGNVSRRIKGKTPWDMWQIDKIIEISGKTYEELFRRAK